MRRAIMLALVALTLPTATLASSISFTTGTFGSGTITSNLGNPFLRFSSWNERNNHYA